jgi:hypothetical protein
MRLQVCDLVLKEPGVSEQMLINRAKVRLTRVLGIRGR